MPKTTLVQNYDRKKIFTFIFQCKHHMKYFHVHKKIISVSSSFIISCILLISAAINLVSIGENGEGGKYPTVTQSQFKFGFETSS